MFLKYVIKIDKRKVLRLYFEHFHVLLLFIVFQENYPYAVKVNNFGSYLLLYPLDQANLICCWHMSSKLIKEKYSGHILSIFVWFCCF